MQHDHHDDASSRRLAALLRDRREELIQMWTERVLRDPRLDDASRLSVPELCDHVPDIIDDLVRVLEASEASEASGRDIGSNEAAKEHARHRLSRGFELAETLREFSHFRAALVDLCNAERVPLNCEAAELVHATIDQNMITGAVEMERAKVAELEQQGAFRERFVGIVGHDLRSPLQAIELSLGRLLARPDTTPEQGRIVHRAVASVDRMGRMIHDLLDLTRARLGSGIPLTCKPTALDVVCRQVVDELSAVHPGRAIELDAPVSARGGYDADRLAQAVSNLVVNALKFSPPDTPVRVTLREEDDHAILSVHNEGTPIPADGLPHLFDPFWQGAPVASPSKEDSLGLGLFIVKQIVEAHGGSVEVTSTPGNGTTFRVCLPLAQPAQGGEAASLQQRKPSS